MTRAATLLAVDAVVEGVTGLALIAVPGLVARLLFASGLEGAGVIMARVAGMGLAGLALACWLGRHGAAARACTVGILAYNLLVGVYLLILGLGGAMVGILLWPAVLVHAVMAALFAAALPKLPTAEVPR